MNFNSLPSNPLISNTFFPTGGYYSDSLAFVNDSCKRCPNGSFVHLNDAPGKSHFDCKACPTGETLELIYGYILIKMFVSDLKRKLSHFSRQHFMM